MEILAPWFERFGIQYLLPYQTLCIHHILGVSRQTESENAAEFPRRRIVLLPTGYGKTICFALPAQILTGPTLVIYPLRSLMSDQERRFASMGIGFAVLRGGQNPEERHGALESIKSGVAKIVIANPEVLETKSVRFALGSVRFSHIVVDEAHVVSQWGKTFRPSYWRLQQTLGLLKSDQVSAFTATADPDTVRDLRELLGPCERYELRAPPDRPNISYRVYPCVDLVSSVICLLKGGTWTSPVKGPVLVFCSSRALCEWLCLRLRYALGSKNIRFYHAGLSNAEKVHTEHWFYHSNEGVLLATCAYGMGIDKSGLRTVIHAGRPSSLAAFLQESGRAGRDGEPASSIVLDTGALLELRRKSQPSMATKVSETQERQDDEDGGDASRPMLETGETSSMALARFLSGECCRREALMKGLEADLGHCSGCDVCDRDVFRIAPEESGIRSFVRKNRALYLENEAAAEIVKKRVLCAFDEGRVAASIRSMLLRGTLRRSKSPLSPGRLDLPRTPT